MINEENILIEQLARKIIDKKLETPILFFLEAHKPLATLAHHFTVLTEPIASPFVGIDKFKNIQSIFSNRDNIEYLISLLEHNKKNKGH